MGQKANTKGNGRALIKKQKAKSNFAPNPDRPHSGYTNEEKKSVSQFEESPIEAVIFKIEADVDRTFQAVKGDLKQLPTYGNDMLSEEERAIMQKAQDEHKALLQIPRRPKWDRTTDVEELKAAEVQSFTSWRRVLSALGSVAGIKLTPYEMNLDFWRQLWRVTERSDLLIQIVDARDPLLYVCEDLKNYLHEHDCSLNFPLGHKKQHLLLLNKADFLNKAQKQAWVDYFSRKGINVVFFSATEETQRLEEIKAKTLEDEQKSLKDGVDEKSEEETKDEIQVPKEETEDEIQGPKEETKDEIQVPKEETKNEIQGQEEETKDEIQGHEEETKDEIQCNNEETNSSTECSDAQSSTPLDELLNDLVQRDVAGEPEEDTEEHFDSKDYINQPVTLNGPQLIKIFKSHDNPVRFNRNYLTIGMVGYPNVGKGSTINCLLQDKKVAVSVTPGKTKHFQTLHLSKDMVLCDCPGLIFPAFVYSKEEMFISGILSIDQLRDYTGPMNEIISRVPRHVLEATYGIQLPVSPGRQNQRVTVEELLNTYGCIRGFMTPGGMPDRPKTARSILKDFVNGELLYCKAPPDVDQEKYFTPIAIKERKINPRPVQKVLIKNEEPIIIRKSQVQVNFVNDPRKRPANSQREGKWWREELKQKRNTHQKLRNRYPQEY